MKHLLILIIVLSFPALITAQPPAKFSYQKVIRNSNNELVLNTRIGLKIDILQGSESGNSVYSEVHTTTTNKNGLATITIGSEPGESLMIENIDWTIGPYYIKTEIDPAGGTEYTISETTQILSLPFALHAKSAERLTGPLPETDPVYKTSAAAEIKKADTTFWNQKQSVVTVGKGLKLSGNVISIDDKYFKGDTTKAVDQLGEGIAARFPGDEGIENHAAVVFTENFEAGTLAAVLNNWTWSRGADDHRLSLDTIPGPEGSTGNKSLKMTIKNGVGGDGSDLRKILDEGHEQLFFRFYVKFAEDYGYNHHFNSLSGQIDPTPWPVGSAGQKPTDRFSSTIDQLTRNINLTGPDHTPPGYWMMYSYWPEMRSWQTVEGEPDGRPNPYYGNNFMPYNPVPAKRGEWQCIEIMIRLNSAPDKADGAHAFWIDGVLAGHWDPKEANPVEGYWIRENFRHNPTHASAQPFEGMKWRTLEDPEQFEKLKINIIRLQNYVSSTSWESAQNYLNNNPGFNINMEEATVWKDHVVVATEYIGPMVPKEE